MMLELDSTTLGSQMLELNSTTIGSLRNINSFHTHTHTEKRGILSYNRIRSDMNHSRKNRFAL